MSCVKCDETCWRFVSILRERERALRTPTEPWFFQSFSELNSTERRLVKKWFWAPKNQIGSYSNYDPGFLPIFALYGIINCQFMDYSFSWNSVRCHMATSSEIGIEVIRLWLAGSFDK